MTSTRLTIITLTLSFLTGCIDISIMGGTYAVRSSDRDELEIKASAGDVQSQYQLGKQWCCFGPGFDTQIATQWLCQAARSGHRDAQYELGRIYQGGIFRIPAFGPKMMSLVFGRESDPDAYYWYSLAAAQGHERALKKMKNLEEDLSEEDREILSQLQSDLSSARCEHREVFPDKYQDETEIDSHQENEPAEPVHSSGSMEETDDFNQFSGLFFHGSA